MRVSYILTIRTSRRIAKKQRLDERFIKKKLHDLSQLKLNKTIVEYPIGPEM